MEVVAKVTHGNTRVMILRRPSAVSTLTMWKSSLTCVSIFPNASISSWFSDFAFGSRNVATPAGFD